MKIREENGKRMIEKNLLRFACDCDNTHTLTTKADLLSTFRDYLSNANDPRYAASVADDSWQIGIDGWNQMFQKHEVLFLDSSDAEITLKMVKDALFILYYNPCEFQAWVGNQDALKQYGGEYAIEKIWSEL